MRLVLLAVAAACNPVFGIDRTDIAPDDRDRDGIEDTDDNCPDVANPDQVETDGDALGDACDGCPGTLADSNHDEDLDGRPDVCDTCPALDDFGFDLDTDGVGDACDNSMISVRRVFEPFVTLDRWQGASTWSTTVDHTAGPAAPLAASDRGIELPDLVTTNRFAVVTVALVSSVRWSAGERSGVSLHGVGTGLTSSCVIACSTDEDCTLSLVVEGVQRDSFQVVPNPFVTLTLTIGDTGGPMHEIYCEMLPASGVAYATFVPTSSSWTPSVQASPIMRAAYFEVIE